MSETFQKVAILGGGVLGGSIALALAANENPPKAVLWARRQETADEALGLGIAATPHLQETVSEADLLILAVPVGAMPALLSSSLEAGLKPGCLVTDVGSVKAAPHHALAPLLKPSGIPFIGSHPMAGSERNGLRAATATLFQNAACILTNDHRAPSSLAGALEHFWKSLGCRTSWMTAAVHDELVARISHLPHILAASGARVCLQDTSEGRFGGGGLRDTTRVAGGNPEMWAEILVENREAIIAPLRETIADLREILATLESADLEKARNWLALGKQRRDTLN